MAGGLTGFSPDRPLLLVTDYPADTPGGGAVILRGLLEGPDRECVVWASPTPPDDPNAAGAVTLKRGSSGRRGRRSMLLDSTLYAGSLAREVAELARQRSARAVWMVMHGAVVHVAARLTRPKAVPLSLPVHLTVHDDPAFATALRSRRYLALVPLIEHDFAGSLRRATSVDVIGEAMRERYLRRYGVASVVVHRGLPGSIVESPRYDRQGLGLSVGVLGNTYSYGQLPVLARAVARAAEQLGVPGSVVVLGRSHGETLRAEMAAGRIDVRIEVAGHVSESEGVDRLRRCFALYLNYPFAARDRVLRQTSFPTKLSTYAMAARPLLLHMPEDSSASALARVWGRYATLWPSFDEGEGAAHLVRLWNAPASDMSYHDEAEAVRLAYYDPTRNREILCAALNALVPSSL
jgi:hypothetical protein